MTIKLLKDIRAKLREQFDKEWKTWTAKKRYNYALTIDGLDYTIKYMEKFEDETKN